MIHKIPDDVQTMIDAQMASGQYEDEAAVLREAMSGLQEYNDDVAAVQSAIDKWQAGDEGMPVDEAFEMVRREIDGK